MKYRCTFCCKDSAVSPCEHCGQEIALHVKGSKHRHEWSRNTLKTVICKACDKVITSEDYFSGNFDNEGE